MHLIRALVDGQPRCGIMENGSVHLFTKEAPLIGAVAMAGDMCGLIAAANGKADALAREALAKGQVDTMPAERVRLLAPLANPGKIICAWVNFPNPAMAKMPEVPIVFSKYASAITNPGDPIVLPIIANNIVVEPELTAVIGTRGKHVTPEQAMDLVMGYTIVNDVTAFSHRLQELLGSQGPYGLAKSFDSFAPMGPVIALTEGFGDPHNVRIRQWTSEELQTDERSASMIYRLPTLISYLSGFFMLEPGDIIMCGSPFPLGGKPCFLKDGDTVRIEIEGIGILESPVIAEAPSA